MASCRTVRDEATIDRGVPGHNLRIVQVNVGHCKDAMPELREWLATTRVDLALIQEPYCFRGKVRGLGLNAVIVEGLGDEEKLAAIAVLNKKLRVIAVSSLTDRETATAVVTCPDGYEIVVSSMYWEGDGDIEEQIDKVRALREKFPDKELLIGADVNAHSPHWFSGELNDRGETLDEYLSEGGLYVVNRPSMHKTFRGYQGRDENVDLTLATLGTLERIEENWEVYDGLVFPDHRPVVIHCRLGKRQKQFEVKGRFKTRDQDWDAYRAELGGRYAGHRPDEDLAGRVDKLEGALAEAAEVSLGRTRPCGITKVTWWTQELRDAKSRVNKLRKAWQNIRGNGERSEESEVRKAAWRSAQAKLKGAVRQAKRQSWKDFTSTVGAGDPWSLVYRLQSGKVSSATVLNTVRVGDSETRDLSETYEALCAKFFPRDSTVDDDEEHSQLRRAYWNPSTAEADDVVPEELVYSCLMSMGSRKAPGRDGIEVIMVKEAWKVINEELLGIVRECLRLGAFPQKWKTGRLVILRKPGKPVEEVGSYRPITLLPVLGKLVEKVVAFKMRKWMISEGVIGERQFGFMPGRSTADALIELKRVVDAAEEDYVWGIFIDIKGAFDNAWPPLLMEILRQKGCPGNIVAFLQNYLQGREVIVGEERTFTIEKGCPQGSVVGPPIWIVILSEWENGPIVIVLPGIVILIYADDIIIVVMGNTKREIQTRGQAAVDCLGKWLRRAKLQTADPKCVVMCLKAAKNPRVRGRKRGRKGGIRWQPTIRPYGSDRGMRVVKSAKHLGVLISENFSFYNEVKARSINAKTIMTAMKRVCAPTWGVGPKVMMVMYKSVYMPIILYGAGVWGHVIHQNVREGKDRVRASQRSALIAATGSYRTVSFVAVVALAGVLPIDHEIEIRRQIENRKYDLLKEGTSKKEKQIEAATLERTLRAEAWEKWQREWENEHRGVRTRRFIPDVKEWALTETRVGTYMSGYITGHLGVNSFLRSVGATDTDLCPCGEVETVDHVVWNCCLYQETRLNLIAEIGENDPSDLKVGSTYRAIGKAIQAIMDQRKVMMVAPRVPRFVEPADSEQDPDEPEEVEEDQPAGEAAVADGPPQVSGRVSGGASATSDSGDGADGPGSFSEIFVPGPSGPVRGEEDGAGGFSQVFDPAPSTSEPAAIEAALGRVAQRDRGSENGETASETPSGETGAEHPRLRLRSKRSTVANPKPPRVRKDPRDEEGRILRKPRAINLGKRGGNDLMWSRNQPYRSATSKCKRTTVKKQSTINERAEGRGKARPSGNETDSTDSANSGNGGREGIG